MTKIRNKYNITGAAILLFLLLAAVISISALTGAGQKTQIVWYLEDPAFYGVQDAIPFEEIKSERFDLFNKRLEELDIPAKVVFKYQGLAEPSANSYEDGSWIEKSILGEAQNTRYLVRQDPQADIAGFSPAEYSLFHTLDAFLESEDGRKAREALPEKIWEANRIKGKLFQIPRGNVSVHGTAYCFRKSFLDQYQIRLDEEKIKKMTPEEVVRWLQPCFGDGGLLDDTYCLTDPAYLDFTNYFCDRLVPVLTGTTNNIYLDLKGKRIVDGLSLREIQREFQLYQYIYRNDLDAHTQVSQSPVPVFSMEQMPELSMLREKDEEQEWQNVSTDRMYVCKSRGNGVLTGSEHPQLAMQVLAASVCDATLSNLMIHGVEGKDYELKGGHAVSHGNTHLSYLGSFSAVGNNLIAYPNELEVTDKEEKTRQLLQQIPVIPLLNFTPEWDQDMLEKMSRLAAVYQETAAQVMYSGVKDLNAYLAKQQKKLEKEGLAEMISFLSAQADSWEE